MPEWAYYPEYHSYRDTATGRWASRKRVQSWVTSSMKRSGAATDFLSQTLDAGLLRVDDWQLLMRNEIKEEYVRQYLLGKGALPQMTQADYGSIGGMLKEQYGHLDGFAADVAAGKLSEGGPGSGHWGHAGTPGKRGGSMPKSVAMSVATGRTAAARQKAARAAGGGPQPGTVPEEEYPSKPSTRTDQKANDFLADGLMQGPVEYASADVRGKAKDELVTALADRTGLEYGEVNDMVRQWAHTSADETLRSLEIQMAVAKANGIKPEKYLQNKYDKTLGEAKAWKPLPATSVYHSATRPAGLQSWSDNRISPAKVSTFAKGVQSYTQERFKASGFKPTDTLTLYRGYGSKAQKLSAGDIVNAPLNPASSWSSSFNVARGFVGASGVVVKMDIPVSSILATARTGMGCLSEAEYVLLGIPGHQAIAVTSGGGGGY